MEGWLPQREVDERVRALVNSARSEFVIPEGCDGAIACRALGLSVDDGELPGGVDGLLVGRQIVLNRVVTWAPRREFTIFHEVVHHLMDEDGELIEMFTTMYRRDDAAFRREVERCCNLGAAEFMMPRVRVFEAINTAGFSISLALRLAEEHRTSIVAAAQQLASCAPRDSYVIIAVAGSAPWLPLRSDGLCIEYAFPSPDTRYPLARYTTIPDDHLLALSWGTAERAAGSTFIPFRSGKRRPCYGESVSLSNRVLAFLGTRPPVPSAQIPLPLL